MAAGRARHVQTLGAYGAQRTLPPLLAGPIALFSGRR